MADQESFGGLHIDSDWKSEAAREKEKLAEREKGPERLGGEAYPPTSAFLEIVNLVAMQAAIAVGGFQGPGGERLPPNPVSARHFIDMLEVLQVKTRGNLTDDEQKILEAVLYELRIQFVHVFSPSPPAAQEKGTKA